MKKTVSGYRFLILLEISVVILCIIPGACKKDPEIIDKPFVRLLENESIQSTLLKRNVNYAVLLPENYNTSTNTFPVVYLLHGFGDNQTAWYKFGLIQYYSDLYASETMPAIYIMPQGFNSYYINKFNGNFPYMDFFTNELVPEIDSIYRTKKDKSQRAVMGFSMGGYGAFILPALNPEIFTVSVSLSMSFRTDEQYIAESQDAFNYQWASNFGGNGSVGSSRITDYFKLNSPFYFFKEGDLEPFNGIRFFIDCGDDEESLSFTNNSLHSIMRDQSIAHEYRVSNGGHSWDYWKKSLPDAFRFIANSFQGINYDDTPEVVDAGITVPNGNIEFINLTGTEIQSAVLIPPGYDTLSSTYPVIYFVHDNLAGNSEEQREQAFTFLYNSMLSSKLPKAFVMDIPFEPALIEESKLQEIISQFDLAFKTKNTKNGRMLIANGAGGRFAASFVVSDTSLIGSCCLFNSLLDDSTSSSDGRVFYYLYCGDDGQSYRGIQNLYYDLRKKGNDYEYRVAKGSDSFGSFMSGLSSSIPILKKRLSITS